MSFKHLFYRASFVNLRFLICQQYIPCTGIVPERNYSKIVLSEDDLEEKFVKGFGKGGQKVNKSNNCVELKHLPTGIAVKCHQTRYLERNRTLAREILMGKLDYFYNGMESEMAKKWAKIRKRKADYVRKRSIKKALLSKQEHQDSNCK